MGDKRGILISTGDHGYWYGTHNYRKIVIPVKEAVKAMETAYGYWSSSDPKAAKMLDRAHGFATEYPWDRTFKEVTDAMKSLYSREPKVLVA